MKYSNLSITVLLFVLLVFSSCEKPCYNVTCDDDVAKKAFLPCKVCPEGICPPNWKLCQGQCINPQTDLNNCNECGRKCPQGQICDKGRCTLVCPTSTSVECFGGCHDINTDINHCGECGNKCPPGLICSDGKCTCPGTLRNCSGLCVDQMTSRDHCGGCNKKCPEGTYCDNGQCRTTCPLATPTNCFGGCYDLKTDVNHCGDCNIKCPTGQTCVNGVCL